MDALKLLFQKVRSIVFFFKVLNLFKNDYDLIYDGEKLLVFSYFKKSKVTFLKTYHFNKLHLIANEFFVS